MSERQNICDKEDCPRYGYFLNIKEHPRMKKLSNLAEANIKDGMIYMIEMIHVTHIIKSTCLACEYFTKQDMRAELLKDEALDLLIK